MTPKTKPATPLFPSMHRCLRCGMPQTSEHIDFDELGVCKACRSSEQKMHINWREREKNLRKILDFYKEKAGSNYDCIVPISGGKDSAFQLYLLTKVYGVKPLAVTFSHAWYSKQGRYNLRNLLEKVDVDHFEFTPNRALISKLAKKSLKMIGDSCWHCHMGVEAIPFHFAVKFNIPLIIYGESMAEFSGKTTYLDNPDFDPSHFVDYSAIYYPHEMVDEDITEKDLHIFNSPSQEEIKAKGITRIFLGDFIFWDAERQTEFVRDFLDWREDKVEGTFKGYKSVECIMPGVHDYSKFIKRGFGRGTDFACQDVRSGLMTREQGFQMHLKYDQARPKALDLYSKITGMDEKEFEDTLVDLRKDNAREHMHEDVIKTVEDHEINYSLQEALDRFDEEDEAKRKLHSLRPERLWPTYGRNEASMEGWANDSETSQADEALTRLSASEAMALIRNKDISVTELNRAYLDRIERIDPDIRAWVSLSRSQVEAQSTLLDNAIAKGEDIGPLWGVPVGIKDVFNTADLPTEMGSPIWKGFTPGNDARAVYSLRLGGGVVMGKTVTAEFAIHHPGPTVNPYDFTRSPGTSSSGSAAAVASRMIPLALGTQTAGSTIRPSSYCGLYGMKPSFGIIPRTGVLKTLDVLDHVSFMGLCPDDLQMMSDTLRVRGPNYPFVNKFLENESLQALPSRPLRIAFVKTHTWDSAAPSIREGVTALAQSLSKSGYDVEEVDLPDILTRAHQIHETLYNKSLSYYFKEEYDDHGDQVSDIVRGMIESGREISLESFQTALSEQDLAEIALTEFLEDYDLILSHSTADVAHVGLDTIERPDPCLIWTLSRSPAVNLPIGSGPGGLPFGVQLVSRRYRDDFLLKVCRQLVDHELIPAKAPAPAIVQGE